MSALSPNAIRTKAFIASFREREGCPPTIHDIAAYLDVTTTHARSYINELIVAGFLKPGPNQTESAA